MVVKLKKPKAIVMDITGTVATRAFMSYSQEAKQFMRQNLREYILESWGKRELRLALNFVRIEQEQELKQEFNKLVKPEPKSRYQANKIDQLNVQQSASTYLQQSPQLSSLQLSQQQETKTKMPLIADSKASVEVQADSLISNLLWRLDNPKKNKSPALGLFHLNINEWGYKKGILKTPCYEDSAACLQKWKNKENIKIYITLGSANFLRLVFSNTTSGDLLDLVEGHMNLMEGNRKNFSRLSEMISEPASKILYITRIPFDARLAQQSNIRTVIIIRQDFDPEAISILKNLNERKRKKKKSPSLTSTGLNQANLQIDEQQSPTTTTPDTQILLDETKDQKQTIFNTIPTEETNDLSTASKITAKDIKDFPVIQRLDELVWE